MLGSGARVVVGVRGLVGGRRMEGCPPTRTEREEEEGRGWQTCEVHAMERAGRRAPWIRRDESSRRLADEDSDSETSERATEAVGKRQRRNEAGRGRRINEWAVDGAGRRRAERGRVRGRQGIEEPVGRGSNVPFFFAPFLSYCIAGVHARPAAPAACVRFSLSSLPASLDRLRRSPSL